MTQIAANQAVDLRVLPLFTVPCCRGGRGGGGDRHHKVAAEWCTGHVGGRGLAESEIRLVLLKQTSVFVLKLDHKALRPECTSHRLLLEERRTNSRLKLRIGLHRVRRQILPNVYGCNAEEGGTYGPLSLSMSELVRIRTTRMGVFSGASQPSRAANACTTPMGPSPWAAHGA
jgi:hypothetical protein